MKVVVFLLWWVISCCRKCCCCCCVQLSSGLRRHKPGSSLSPKLDIDCKGWQGLRHNMLDWSIILPYYICCTLWGGDSLQNQSWGWCATKPRLNPTNPHTQPTCSICLSLLLLYPSSSHVRLTAVQDTHEHLHSTIDGETCWSLLNYLLAAAAIL